MKTPSVKNLCETFRDLTVEQAGLIKRIARAVDDPEALAEILGDSSVIHDNKMWRRTRALAAIDRIVGTHGVEALSHPDDDGCFTLGPRWEYLNTGDTYAATLVYHRDADAIRIGSWGDIAERLPSAE